jgi:hypothetical protein
VSKEKEPALGALGGSPECDVKPTRKLPRCHHFNWLSKGAFAVLLALASLRFFGPLHYDPKAVAYRNWEAARVGYNFYKTGDWTSPFGSIATGPTAHVAPAFPVLLATIYHVFGDRARGRFFVGFLEAAALTLQVSLLPILARFLGLSLSVGFIAEIIAIICVRPTAVWEQSYVALLLVVATLAACRYLRIIEMAGASASAAASAAVVGVLWGLLLLTGPSTGLVWVGWVAMGAVYSWRRGFRAAWLPALILPLLMLAPWTWRNYRVLGHPVLVRSDLGLELAVSNNPCAKYSWLLNEKSGCFWKNHPYLSTENCSLVLALGEVNYNRMKMAQAVTWIRENQRQFWRLTGERFVCFWFPDVLSGPHGPSSSWILYLATALSIPGIFFLWREHSKAACLCLSFLVLFPPIYYILDFDKRYRYPITWVTCLVAAYPIDLIFRRWQATHEAQLRSQRIMSSVTRLIVAR